MQEPVFQWSKLASPMKTKLISYLKKGWFLLIVLSMYQVHASTPVFTSPTSVSVPENTSGTVYTAVATDDLTLSYALVGSTDDEFFSIDPSSGEIAFRLVPDFENPLDSDQSNDYEITVEASDGTNTNTLSVTIDITNVEDDKAYSLNTSSAFEFASYQAVVHYDVPNDEVIITLDLNGEDEDFTEWMAVGFGAQVMDGTYAIVIENDGTDNFTVSERILGATGLGEATDVQEVVIESQNFVEKTITLSRPMTSTATGGYSFSTTNTYFDYVWAYGDVIGSAHLERGAGTIQTPDEVTPEITSYDFSYVYQDADIYINGERQFAYRIEATDANPITYSLAAGGDNDLFVVDPTTGRVEFKFKPDLDNLIDANEDGVYELTVQASDHTNTSSLAVEVMVNQTIGFSLNTTDALPFTEYRAEILLDEETREALFFFDMNGEDEEFIEWMAIGLGSNIMDGTYAIVVENDGTDNFTVTERILGASDLGSATDVQELTIVSQDFENRTITVKRPMASSATGGYSISLANSTIDYIWAFGETVGSAHTERGYGTINTPDYFSPQITSPVFATVPENTTGVFYQLTVFDDNEVTMYLEPIGADEDLFDFDPETGNLSLTSPLDFENPQGVIDDHYYVVLAADDVEGNGNSIELEVIVTNVDEDPVITSEPITSIYSDEMYNYLPRVDELDIVSVVGTTLPEWLSIEEGFEVSTDAPGNVGNITQGTRDKDGNTIVTYFNRPFIVYPSGDRHEIYGDLDLEFKELGTPSSDSEGNIYVPDSTRILKITPGLEVTIFAGANTPGSADGTGTAAQFNKATEVLVDENDNLIVLDQYLAHTVVRMVTPEGVVSTVTGQIGDGDIVDGTNAIAEIGLAQNLIQLANGDIYFTDLDNVSGQYHLRQLTLSGDVSTIGLKDAEGNALTLDLLFWSGGLGDDILVVRKLDSAPSTTIEVLQPDGRLIHFAGTSAISFNVTDGELNDATFYTPRDIFTHFKDEVWIVDFLKRSRRIYNGFRLKGSPEGLVGDFPVSLTITDRGGNETTHDFTVTVIDADPPVYTSESMVRVDENTSIVYQAVVEDISPVTFSLTGKYGDGALFSVDEVTGELSFLSSPDFENPLDAEGDNIYWVEIEANDGENATYLDVSIIVSNINDNSPVISSDPVVSVNDVDGYLYELDVLDTDGEELSVAGTLPSWMHINEFQRVNTPALKGISLPTGINGAAISPNGNIYVNTATEIYRITPDSTVSLLVNSSAGLVQMYASPYVDEKEIVYVGTNQRIYKIDPMGNLEVFVGSGVIGSADGTGSAAEFNFPRGMDMDSEGNLYVTDNNNHTIRKVTPEGVVTTIAGQVGAPGFANGAGPAAQFQYPEDLVVTDEGFLLVADQINHRIRKVLFDGTVTTFSGTGVIGQTNGDPSTATYADPRAIVKAEGGYFVVDRRTEIIRFLDESGNVSTYAGTGDAGTLDGLAHEATFENVQTLVVHGSNKLTTFSDQGVARTISQYFEVVSDENITFGSYDIGLVVSDGVNDVNQDFTLEVAEVINTWDGTTWSDGVAPSGTQSGRLAANYDAAVEGNLYSNVIKISAGVKLTIDPSSRVYVREELEVEGEVIVNEGGELVLEGIKTGTGPVVINRSVPGALAYSMVGSPIIGQSLSTINADFVYGFDGSDYVVPTGDLSSAEGYFMAFTDPKELQFSGDPVTGDLSYSGLDSDKYYLLSNPYTSQLRRTEFAANNTSIDGTIYLWNDGGANLDGKRVGTYTTINDLDPNAGGFDGTIEVTQGFFVHTISAGSVNFNPLMQNYAYLANNTRQATSSYDKQLIRLRLTSGDLQDELLIGLLDEATMGFDPGLDAEKLFNTHHSFFVSNEEKHYSISALPQAENIAVNLGYTSVNKHEKMKLEVTELSGFALGTQVLLFDRQTSQIYDLANSRTITISDLGKPSATRFELFINANVLGEEELHNSSLQVGVDDSELLIKYYEDGVFDIAIYDLLGRSVYTDLVRIDKHQALINVGLNSNQVYILQVGEQRVKFIY